MNITMDDSHVGSIAQLQELLKLTNKVEFKGKNKEEVYEWIGRTLGKFRYFSLKKKERSVVKHYIETMTGLSRSQVTRLIGRKRKTGRVFIKKSERNRFETWYTKEDIATLIETDNAHSRLSGPATRRVFKRMYENYDDIRFERLSRISISHIYNLRKTRQYESHSLTHIKTNPVKIPIGERRKPNPQGKPGYLRVDTVHQGDLDKEKGVYHVNIVDEVTQWEVVGCVEKISESYLAPLLENLLEQFPFEILGFHSDCGSEYINYRVAKLLQKVLVEQTKSRVRHCNDNALVEGKNGSVIRKYFGHNYIPKKHAEKINKFYREYFNPYLNFHRPCGFATVKTDRRGKQIKRYDVYLTPFEALCAHPGALEFLKDGITLEKLKVSARKQSDNECAALMRRKRGELFSSFKKS
jgi:transposase InsO family protein